MKILQINCVYKKGSTGKLVYDIHTGLAESGYESIVCYGNGPKYNEKNVYKTSSTLLGKINALRARITGLMYGGCFIATNKLIGVIKKENPDVVHVHCPNGNMTNIYRLITFLKKSKIKTVLTLHAEIMHTANCEHAEECEKWKTGCGKCPRLKVATTSWFFDGTHRSFVKMKKAFEGFETLKITSVSPWLMERAKQSPILGGFDHCVVYNGLDTSVFNLKDASDLKQKHGLTNEKIILHVTPRFSNVKGHNKGGYYILELAKMLEKENVKILVAGSCETEFDIPENVIMLGKVSNQQELAKYYSLADVTVIASKRETFSMVVAESLSCGTPVAGFYAGGPEQIAIKEHSAFSQYGDTDALCEGVLNLLDKENNKQEISNKAALVYSKSKMVNDYIKAYNW